MVRITGASVMPPWSSTPRKAVRPVTPQIVVGAVTIGFTKKLLRSYGPNRLFIRLNHDSLELLDRCDGQEKVISRAIVEASGRALVDGKPLMYGDVEVSLSSPVSIYVGAEYLFPELGTGETPKGPSRADFFAGCYEYNAQLAARLQTKLAGIAVTELENTFLENNLFRTSLRQLVRFANGYLRATGQSAKMIEKLSILLIGGSSLLNSDLSCGAEQQNELAREVIFLSLEFANHPLEAVRENLKLQIPRLVKVLNQKQLAIFQAHLGAK